jgi:hypothetical protein
VLEAFIGPEFTSNGSEVVADSAFDVDRSVFARRGTQWALQPKCRVAAHLVYGHQSD